MPGTMTELDFKRECESMVREYFTHGVMADVLTSVLDLLDRAETPTPLGHTRLLNPSTTRPAVVKRAVVASLDRGPREREMAARFLQALAVHEVIAPAHLEAGFDLILQDLDSLVIDVPRVPTELSHFISRAVVDGVVSRKFLDDSADAEGVDITSHQVAVTARGALRQPGGESHVRAVWGGPEGTTADAARREMRNLLEEYISSGDVAEASRRLAELGVPFYHHEFVRRALTHAIESFAVNSQRPRTITRLLGYLNATGLVSGTQFAKGFARVATSLTEITLDVPDARERFEELVGVAKDEGLLPAALSAWASLRDCGVRGSKELTGCDGLKPVGDNRSLRGHMLRLDSAPDLIQLAEIVGGSRSPVEVDTESNSTEIPAALHLSPANERGKCANERSTTASVLSPESMYIMDDGSHKNESVGIAPAIGKAIIDRCNGALSSASVPNGNQLNSGWSGFRVMRTKYFNDIAFSGNRVNDINKTGTSPGLPIIAAHTNRLLLGKCAWRALYKPAPQRVSGEDAAPWRKQAFLRRVRLMRRSRSCPGGLFELNNAAHVLSIGSVHRHRPFENDYLLGDPVGTGGFAVVREAIHIVSGETFAVKTLRVKLDSGKECGISTGSRDDADSEDTNSQNKEGSEGWKTHRTASMSMEEVTNELVLMQQLSGHPNIVTIKEFFTEDSPSASTSVSKTARDQPNECIVHVVMEFLRGQELVDFITEVGMCVEHDARQVMCPMLDAIAYMHASGVVHRDLKLENLVLARPYDLSSVTLVDFGLAKALKARERAENVCGTLAYIAPEALVVGEYGQGVDVWALGVAMHALLTGAWPFDDDDDDSLMDAIVSCDLDFDHDEIYSEVSPEAKDLLSGLLESNPKHRLTACQALEHAWFTGQKTHTSARLHHLHTRLDALAGSSRQHPERRFKPGARLVTCGEISDEIFVITAGECDLIKKVGYDDNKSLTLLRRRKGNIVGEIPSDVIRGVSAQAPLSSVTVVAVTEVRALVFDQIDVNWAIRHDYRLSGEFERALRAQRKALAKEYRSASRTARDKAQMQKAECNMLFSKRGKSEVLQRDSVEIASESRPSMENL